ncbi:MAG: hypothetical protein JNN07_11615 [Verrucomicrobiales bacterium]|nr:hypothetical protein [Verrucomicrobiales bacterium]
MKYVCPIGPAVRALGCGLFLTIAQMGQAAFSPDDEVPAVRLAVEKPLHQEALVLRGEAVGPGPDPGTVFHLLEKSPDLRQWRELAQVHHAPFIYSDPTWQDSNPAYYRARTLPRTPTNDWANLLRFPDDPFWKRSDCDSVDRLQWAKFLILVEDPNRVYFQDNSAYLLHYEFATQRFAPFQGLSADAFDAIALHRDGQRVILGSVLAPLAGDEFAIQFVGVDPYPPAQIASWFHRVRDCVASAPSTPVLYLPSYEQAEWIRDQGAEYAALGMPVISASRWLDTTTVCYAPGWAVGRLVYVASGSIEDAYASGALIPTDILLTDAIPSELPFVSGIISLTPATPNSHVAILADSYGIPFIYLADPTEQARIRGLDQQEVLFRTGLTLSACDISIRPLRDPITPGFRQVVVASQINESLQFSPKESYPSIVSLTDTLSPSDIRYFGGKAANFGILRRVIPDYSPEAIAFSFDLWDGFLAQVMPDGSTLRQMIESRLGGYIYPPDVQALKSDLSFLRDQIIRVAQFSPGLRQLVLNSVERFGSSRKIRFRSSTNVEDSEFFSGAGLYDSYSGCLGDDLDDDEDGPSVCDPHDKTERGVLLAIRKVFASFYNDNAFLERLRLGVSEDQAGMAVLVHYSTPDDIEMANGVATVRAVRVGSNWTFTTQLVTQKGALSVANPDPGILSEQVDYVPLMVGTNLHHRKSSSLVPLGSTVLTWPGDYDLLGGLITDVSKVFVKEITNRTEVHLDLEFKKISPGRLEIKQVREIPFRDPDHPIPAFLASQVTDLIPYGSILATHRLKSSWRIGNSNTALTSPSLVRNAWNLTEATYREGNSLVARTNPITQWPRARFGGSNSLASFWMWTTNTWGSELEPDRTWTLVTRYDKTVLFSQSPARLLSDATIQLSTRYPAALPGLSLIGDPVVTSVWEESVTLYPVSLEGNSQPTLVLLTTNGLSWSLSQRLERVVGSSTGPIPRPDCSSIPGKSPYAYVARGGTMRLEGLIAEPLDLQGEFSQTFILRGREGHETIYEAVADPWMEPELPAAARTALAAANIRQVVYYSYSFGDFKEYVFIIGLDGSIRRWEQ